MFVLSECTINCSLDRIEFKESTDFTDTQTQQLKTKINKRMAKFNTDKINISFVNKNMYNITSASSKETCNSETIIKHFEMGIKQEKHEDIPDRKRERPVKNDRSKMLHKVIPYISSIFGWPSKVKEMSVIKRTQVQIMHTDNGCQTGFKTRPRLRRLKRMHRCYDDQAARPLCLSYNEDNNDNCRDYIPFDDKKIVRKGKPLFPGPYRNRTICKTKKSFSSSSEANISMTTVGIMTKTSAKSTQVEKKYFQKRQHYHHNRACQLFNNTTQYARLHDASVSPKCSICRHPSSGFWEYLAKKITSACHAHSTTKNKATPQLQCKCPVPEKCENPSPRKSLQKCKCPSPRPKCPAENQGKIKLCQLPHDVAQKTLSDKFKGDIVCVHNPQCILINGCLNIPGNEDASMTVYPVQTQTSASEDQKYSVANNISNLKSAGCQYTCTENQRHEGCQFNPFDTPGENLTNSTIDSNHCPPEQTAFSEHPDRLVRDNSSRLTLLDQFSAKHYIDLACIQSKDLIIQELTHDKLTRPYHPACEVIRTFCRTGAEVIRQADLKDQESCDYVPRYDNIIPLHDLVDNPETTSQQSPNRDDVYAGKTTLLAGDEVAKSPADTNVCEHKSPCIMIPKCLAKILCNSLTSREAIPDCSHQPLCKLIPACCRTKRKRKRKRKEIMSGASSSNRTEKRASIISWNKRWKSQNHGRFQYRKVTLR